MVNDNPNVSLKRLFLGTVAAVTVAVIILVLFVLPAEYGKDITGIGKKIGINGMSVSPSDTLSQNPKSEKANEGGSPHISFDTPVQFMETEIVLEAYGQAEYKFEMQAGQKVSYKWSVEGGLAYADLHGHTPDLSVSGEGEVLVRYLESDTVSGASGEFKTPFSGEHGWYFLNLETTEIKIKVSASGHWDTRELIPLASQI